jgi:hypothetical protein
MIIKLYYSGAESKLVKHKVEVFENDIVKKLGQETLYKVLMVHNSDTNFNFGTCHIINMETYTEGYKSFPVSELIFVEREFYDPEHF